MEDKGIVIRIPPWVVERWESIVDRGQMISDTCTEYSESIWTNLITNQRNSFIVILSMILFWPFYAYCFVAVTTASTWIFWLFASVLMGIIQMNFVAYQFFMISVDIFFLTLLKTYQVIMRSRVAQFVFFFSKRIRTSRQKMWRRREWRKQCESVTDWEEYLKLPVWENSSSLSVAEAMAVSSEEDAPSSHDCLKQQPALRRSTSFAALKVLAENLHEGDDDDRSSTSDGGSENIRPRKPMHKRTSSMSKLQFMQDEAELTHHTKHYSDLEQDLGPSTADLLISTTARIREERIKLSHGRDSGLEFLLQSVVKRNHLGLENLLVTNGRDVEVSGQYGFSAATRKAIARYYDEVSKGLEVLTDEEITDTATRNETASELRSRILLFRKMKQNMGRTALMLSGGGAQAMYHLGTMRALIQSNLYHKIKVISGTSGGSIAAACCAMFTPEEIFQDVCVATVSTDYLLNGEMKRRNIRWFPAFADMVSYWLKHRLLVDSEVRYSFNLLCYISITSCSYIIIMVPTNIYDPKYGRKYQDTTNCVIHSFVTLILLVLEIHISTISISAPHVNSIGAARHLPKHSKGQGNMFVLQSLLVVLVQVPPSVFCSIIFRHRTSHWQVLLRLVALCQA